MTSTLRPKLIAICGSPGSGKTTAAEFFVARYGAKLVDDGSFIREGCMSVYGLTREQVYTQEGKASYVDVCGERFQVRQLLGDYGKLFEKKHGDQFVPERAVSTIDLTASHPWVFGSVRMNQGITYNKYGGIVIRIDGTSPDPVYDFDKWDESLVNTVIPNKGTKQDLYRSISTIFDPIYAL